MKENNMKIVFVSNYFNHHQKPLCDSLYNTKDIIFHFVSTSFMREERKKMGYNTIDVPNYVIHGESSESDLEKAQKMIDEADAVICGLPPRALLKSRIKRNKIVFYYTERPLKIAPSAIKKFKLKLSWKSRAPKRKPVYLLAAGAYTVSDYNSLGVFKDKAYKWGYFPQSKKHEEEIVKLPNSILWCGRLLSWKHPMDAVKAALNLKNGGYSFNLKIIGNGEEEAKIKNFVSENVLSDCVEVCNFMPPEQIRSEMEKSEIYLFTSDGQEGWGAVLNESMNSRCAVIASDEAGASHFLIKDNENGLIYESGNVDMLTEKLKALLDSKEEQKRLGANAYKTISEEWNAETAAKRFIILAKSIINGNAHPELFPTGPCSIAE